jgi:hypothetical protein
MHKHEKEANDKILFVFPRHWSETRFLSGPTIIYLNKIESFCMEKEKTKEKYTEQSKFPVLELLRTISFNGHLAISNQAPNFRTLPRLQEQESTFKKKTNVDG